MGERLGRHRGTAVGVNRQSRRINRFAGDRRHPVEQVPVGDEAGVVHDALPSTAIEVGPVIVAVLADEEPVADEIAGKA